MKFGICLLLVSCGTLFLSCKKETKYHYVNDDHKWISFPGKTYWIMADSLTGQLDSISTEGANSRDYSPGLDKWESIHYWFSHWDSQKNNFAGWDLILQSTKEGSRSLIFYSSTSQGLKLYCDPFINSPFVTSGHNNFYEETYSFARLVPAAVVRGVTFHDVIHVRYSFPKSGGEFHWYINKDVGLVKIVIKINNVKRILETVRWK